VGQLRTNNIRLYQHDDALSLTVEGTSFLNCLGHYQFAHDL